MMLRQVLDDTHPLGIVRAVDQKYCPGCNSWKATRHFHQDRHRPDGLYRVCKSCRRPLQAAATKRAGERRREAKRRYREENRDFLRAQANAYRRLHPDSDRERARAYRQRNREAVNARRRARYAANAELERAVARQRREHARAMRKGHKGR